MSFQVEKGEILGYLGPNGAGKTTTMRIITGYMPASEGKAVVAGFDVFDQPIEAKRRTGYLPETPPLYPDMNVRESMLSVAKIKGLRKDITSRVNEVMKRTWVTDMADRQCGKLSKGYRQRVGLAQAIIHNPDVLLPDEPTACPEVSQTCSRVVIINKGKVVAIDTPDALTERLRGTVTMHVEAEGNTDDLVSTMRNVQGVVRVSVSEARDGSTAFEVDSEKGADIRRGLAHAIVGAGHGLLELRPMRMSLEDIFLSLTTEEQSQEEAAEQEVVNAERHGHPPAGGK